MSKILIIDDEADMRFAIRMLLERSGHGVIEAGDGEAALALLAEDGIDLVLLDMRLPGMDGIQILQRIREVRKDVPIVMVTGYGNVELANQALQLGADHYLAKPFHNKELIDVIHSALQKRGVALPEPPAAAEALPETPVGAVPETEAPVEPDQAGVSGWRTWGWKAAAVVICLLGLAIWRHTPERYDFKVPYSNPSAILFSEGHMWVADWFSQSIYIHDLRGRELSLRRTYYLPEVHLTGLARVGDFIYTADSWKKVIRKHRIDEQMTELASVPSPGPAPCSLFWDGSYLWSCDLSSGKIYQHQLNDQLTVVAAYNSPGGSPVGFFKDDRYAWSLDAKTRKLYERRLDAQLTIIGAYQLPEWDEGSSPLSCFTWNGKDLWYARSNQGVLLRRLKKHLLPVR